MVNKISNSRSTLRQAVKPKRFSVLTMLLVVSLAGCSSGLQVRSDSDPSTDFSQFKTFNFFDPMGIEGGYNSSIYGELFRESITSEMTRRGYRLADSPDLMLNVTIRSDDKVRMTSYTAPYMSGAYYSRPGGAYYGSGLGVGVAVGQRAREVTEASVFIDFVDTQKQRAVWQGVAVLEANEKVATHLKDATFTAVDEVFKLYPYTASN